jgi:hypothetical protein
MKVLVAFEKEYRAYMTAIADAIRMFRSNLEVALTTTDQLEAEVERFNPQLVICSSSIPSNPVAPQIMAWIELSPEPDQQSRFQVGEHSWESTNPSLGEILPALDETNRLYRTSHEQGPIETDET